MRWQGAWALCIWFGIERCGELIETLVPGPHTRAPTHTQTTSTLALAGMGRSRKPAFGRVGVAVSVLPYKHKIVGSLVVNVWEEVAREDFVQEQAALQKK